MSKIKKKRRVKKLNLPPWLEFVEFFISDARDWCKGRMWWPRLLLILGFMHLTALHLKDPMCQDIFKGINLGFHEMGHVVFAPFGELMGIAGGSIFQCLVPLLSILMFFRQRDYFAIAFCFGWLSTNLFDVAVYAGDARKLELPLVTPFKGGDEVIHDWNYVLDKLDMLQYDYIIANFLRGAAVVSALIFMTVGFWLVINMMKTRKKTVSDQIESAGF